MMDSKRLVVRRASCAALAVGAVVIAMASLFAPSVAQAAVPPLLWQTPETGMVGTGAGQFNNPRGIAVNPVNGHLFVPDRLNSRVDELTPWGVFVKAWGWGVHNGLSEPQTCNSEVGCQAGLAGAGAGQLDLPRGGIASDAAGDIYVADLENWRIEKFAPSGQFLLTFGGEVNKTTNADVCTAASGNVCGAGVSGTGLGAFSTVTAGTVVAVGNTGTVYVGDGERIQEFNPDGSFKAILPDPGGILIGHPIAALTIDSAGNLYVSQEGSNVVRKLDGASGQALEPTFLAENAGAGSFGLSVATDIYAVADPVGIGPISAEPRILEFDPTGRCVDCGTEGEDGGEGFDRVVDDTVPTGIAVSTACGSEDVYVSHFGAPLGYIRAYGPPPVSSIPGCEPPPAPPTVADQFATSANSEGAVVVAKINPHFWTDVTYFVEFGTGKCSEGGCNRRLPTAPGEDALGTQVGNFPVKTKGTFLGGLAANTTYHFRFVAKSTGGGPTVGAEGTFTTPPPLGSEAGNCPNAQFRIGPSAALPDCRAFEMVSPVNKNNGDIVALNNINDNPARLNRSAVSGNALAFSAFRAFGDTVGAPYVSQYLASRNGEGWSSHALAPPRGVNILGSSGLDVEFDAFSSDLCRGWLLHDSDPVLAAGAVAGFANFYSDDLCSEPPQYGAITTTTPTLSPGSFKPILQGVSADGASALFRVRDKLTPSALPGQYQAYDSKAGTVRLVCVLPSGAASPTGCSVGTAGESFLKDGRSDMVERAVSNDGSRVFWTAASGEIGPGTIYVRLHPDQAQSKLVAGVCTEAARACTYPVSGAASSSPAQYWAANPTGSKVLFTIAAGVGKGDLYEAELKDDGAGHLVTETHLIAHKVAGLLGASEDLSRIYFVSEEALDGSALPGDKNLYLAKEGKTFKFIGRLSSSDTALETQVQVRTPINLVPVSHAAQVSPDGEALVFMSNGSPTGFNNTDAESGEADAEVYLYEAGANAGTGALRCVSCNPTEVRPVGRNLAADVKSTYWADAQIPRADSQLYATHALADNGRRLFFESFEALVPGDTNGMQDVYEWQAPGEGSCSEDKPSFRPTAGGCINLISSGQSSQDSEIIDSSSDGDDVFFATGQSLLPQDPGLIDIYDARVQGGFPPPPSPPSPCQGEACQGPASSPVDQTPSSADYVGPANAGRPAKKPVKCPKGKHKVKKSGKTRCVKKAERKAGKTRRAAR